MFWIGCSNDLLYIFVLVLNDLFCMCIFLTQCFGCCVVMIYCMYLFLLVLNDLFCSCILLIPFLGVVCNNVSCMCCIPVAFWHVDWQG